MMKIKKSCLEILSKAVAAVILSVVSVSTGTISHFGIYEPEMPVALRPQNDEESA